jgi:signal transduction histidine kinase
MFLYASIFAVSLSLALYSMHTYLRYDRRLPVLAFSVLQFAVSAWELSNIVLEMTISADMKLIMHNILNSIVVPSTVFSLLFFALAFSENVRLIKWIVTAFAVNIVGLSVVLVVHPEFLYESRGLVTQGPITVLGFTFEKYVLHNRNLKPTFRLYSLYAYLVVLGSGGVLISYVFAKTDQLYTEQSVLIGVGIGTPLAVNATVFFGVLPPTLNFTDIGFGVSAVCFALAIFRYQLFELPPVGRQQLVNAIDDPLVLLDDGDEVVYSNPTARQLFDVGADWRGMDATDFFAPYAERLQRAGTGGPTDGGPVELAGPDRYFDLNSTTIRTPAGDTGGEVLALREVTELEQTNRRLDQFASMVSHDLRTPLNDAMMQADRLAGAHSDERTEALREELDRMESILDDMLDLARAGSSVETTETCPLEELVEEVWAALRTEGAELDCRVTDTTIQADTVRLFQALENLLRNALDHNDTPLTVRVGTLDGGDGVPPADDPAGFFVEDDGRGIPGDEHDDVFDHGYTTSRNGNGYGLSVVRHIVEAHGWEIRVTDGSDDGARFEITGVESG